MKEWLEKRLEAMMDNVLGGVALIGVLAFVGAIRERERAHVGAQPREVGHMGL
jgi:hypothetical protein